MLELLLFGTAAMDKIIQNRIFRPDAEWVDNGVVLHNSFWKTTLIISSFLLPPNAFRVRVAHHVDYS